MKFGGDNARRQFSELTNIGGQGRHLASRHALFNKRPPQVSLKHRPKAISDLDRGGFAIAGICLIQLRIRPQGLPERLSFRSLNGAHRIAVTTPAGNEAVYIPRRDTNSRLNVLVGGRLFPGTHHLAKITITDDTKRIGMELASRDGSTNVGVAASTTDHIPDNSVFADVEHVSGFFKQGTVGYSDSDEPECFDGIELQTNNWSVTPLAIEHVRSTFFDDRTLFPSGAVQLDNALLMRDIDNTWHRRPSINGRSPASDAPVPATN